MAIKIPSINIRRLYTDEELYLANKKREYEKNIIDIKNLEKLKELKKIGIVQKSDLSELSWQELQMHYLTEYKTNESDEIKTYRDKKRVRVVENFVKNNEHKLHKDTIDFFSRNNDELKEFRRLIREINDELNNMLSVDRDNRSLEDIFETDYVALSDSALSSALNIENDTYSNDIIIITANQEDMMRDIIVSDFLFKGIKYELYGASAGQLRKQKIMFVNSHKLKDGINKLINGLTIEEINKHGGVNINKWSAYMSLPTSATEIWEEVDLRRVCVVEDFETVLRDRLVDHIDDDYKISRITKDVEIPHTDGFGMMHPKFCRDTRMIRAPWIKGLVSPMDYRSFSNTFDGKEIIEDIWGAEYNINDLDMILTKSQFKMWKYYESWTDYVDKFYANGCEFRFMIPESKKDLRLNALFNYQMWQTLSIDNPTEYAKEILEEDLTKIDNAHREVGAMLDMFGVDKKYDKNSLMNKALYLYPQMLNEKYFKKTLNDKILARKSELAEGRIKINGVYTFLIPDTFAWCESLLLGIKEPKGLLSDGEVSCKLVNKDKEIMVNRSPHLYQVEHCVRTNKKEKEHIKWFLSKGVYTSVHDMISKQLFFDVDGDIALVIENDGLVEIAKNTVKDLVPLDFRLEKAYPQIINRNNILESYESAFEANIGYYSNLITKEMNSDRKDIGLVAKICWMNNMAIDKAKTNFFIDPTEDVQDMLDELDNRKLPYFFRWAKDKDFKSVEHPNDNSLVDQMAKEIFGDRKSDKKEDRKYTRFSYKNVGKFNIKKLLNNKKVDDIEYHDGLIDKFNNLSDSKYHTIIRKKHANIDDFTSYDLDEFLKNEMIEYCDVNDIDLELATDMCIKYSFEKAKHRATLFLFFGEIIISRLEKEFSDLLDGSYVRCEICSKKIQKINNKTIYCESCYKKKETKDIKRRVEKHRKSKKCNGIENHSKAI